ncbi:FtsX-like permease family protein [Pseudoalteromonas sp. R3]|uniref:FtsX-like permease family protein n=1 Tax=Pseudoalteromonas sp. R3 TaxID=1709477 RepID=UPI000FDD15EB|nr:FtsX-like permease family protein [Pseudoalteromonas sp. R3]AZZ95696.1 FtsX-like permease family protein [Pseudoalteromonas sp. R3]
MSLAQTVPSNLAVNHKTVSPIHALRVFNTLLWRQILQGKYWLTLAALCVLFVYLLLSSLLGQGVERFLAQNLQSTLGADTQVTVRRPWQKAELDWITTHSTKSSLQSQYRVTLSNHAQHQSAILKAVDSNYPLQGDIHISQSKGLDAQRTQQGPGLGEIWLEPRLAAALSVELGDTLELNGVPLRVSALLLLEPDRILEGLGSDMRAMVSQLSLSGGDLTPHLNRALMLHDTGLSAAIEQFQSSAPSVQVISKSLNNYPLAKVWQRVQNFLGLLSLLIVLLTVLILWLCSQVQVQPLKKSVSVLLACGMERRMLPALAISAGAIILILSLIPALLLALLASYGVSHLAQSYVDGFALYWHWQDLLAALTLATAVYFFIALPMWLVLLRGIFVR